MLADTAPSCALPYHRSSRCDKNELEREPRAIAALTTHGRTAWTEAIIGSVAFRVLREAMRPVLLFRAHEKGCEAPNKITNVTAAVDGSAFSEKILPYAVRAARSLSARLFLVQALPVHLSPTVRQARVGYPRIVLPASTGRRNPSRSWNRSPMGSAAWRTGRCTLSVPKRRPRNVAGNDDSCPCRGEASRTGQHRRILRAARRGASVALLAAVKSIDAHCLHWLVVLFFVSRSEQQRFNAVLGFYDFPAASSDLHLAREAHDECNPDRDLIIRRYY